MTGETTGFRDLGRIDGVTLATEIDFRFASLGLATGEMVMKDDCGVTLVRHSLAERIPRNGAEALMYLRRLSRSVHGPSMLEWKTNLGSQVGGSMFGGKSAQVPHAQCVTR